jgi:hypothetical protein
MGAELGTCRLRNLYTDSWAEKAEERLREV